MANTRHATFFVPNLHCPSCTAQIEEAFYRLSPPPTSVYTSIISHSVTVSYPSNLSLKELKGALDESGFEIFDILEDSAPASSSKVFEKQDDAERGIPSFAFEQALMKWRPHTLNPEDDKRRQHIENCQLCRSQNLVNTEESGETGSSEKKDQAKLVAVATESPSSATKLAQATLAIEGMTCSSCVGSVTRALEEKPYVQSASVSLMTHSAAVKLFGEHHANDLVEAVEDVGFGATLEQVETVAAGDTQKASDVSDLWKATYAVGGMTCSACVGSISRGLIEHSWIKDAEVTLITNSATVVFEGKAHLEKIAEIIEDLGYDASLDTVVDLHTERPTAARRKVSIRVNGIYCEHCPPRIENAIQQLGPISIEKLPSIEDSIMAISYVPRQPSLTIRKIISTISEADEAFSAEIYHPMTLEERSRRMQSKEQWHLLYRVILAIAAAIPSFIIGIVFMELVPSNNRSREYLSKRLAGINRIQWATFILATPVYFFAADVFHRRTIKELRALWRRGSPTPMLRRFYKFGSMNMLISFGTTIAYFASVAELAIVATAQIKPSQESSNPTYFDSVVFLTMFLLIGRLIEAYTKAKTGDAVAELGKLRPTEALLISDDKSETKEGRESTRQVGLDQLEIGDVVRVLNGASPPFDGFIVEGESKFDESSLTGESKPITKMVGDEVYSGTINKDSPVSIRINGVSGSSMLDQIMKVVREGQARRAPVERIADVLTGYFVPVVTLIAIITWVVWMGLGLSQTLPDNYLDIEVGGWPFWALEFAIAVFVVACPCGIGLAAPTALFVGGGLAAKHGILAKGGGEAFQEASVLDCIVFDKTGTLTQGGDPKISDHLIIRDEESNIDDSGILGVVRALESESTHPIAKALAAFCQKQGTRNVKFENVSEVAGRGMKGHLAKDETNVEEALLGNEALMSEYKVDIPPETSKTLQTWKNEGKSIALLGLKIDTPSTAWKIGAAFAISDPPRPEARAVVKALQNRSIDVWMISGDNPTTAYAVGAQIGINRENIIAGVLPSQKSDQIKHLQRSAPQKDARNGWVLGSNPRRGSSGSKSRVTTRRAIVAMVGDGINDSPALTAADVGIAIGSGSDVAISSAEFVLVSSNLTALLTLTDLSRVVFRRIKFNFGWALIYNCLAVPVAAGVLYPLRTMRPDSDHVRLNPVWAALAMALSSISVVCSSLLLRTRLPLVGFRARKIDD